MLKADVTLKYRTESESIFFWLLDQYESVFWCCDSLAGFSLVPGCVPVEMQIKALRWFCNNRRAVRCTLTIPQMFVSLSFQRERTSLLQNEVTSNLQCYQPICSFIFLILLPLLPSSSLHFIHLLPVSPSFLSSQCSAFFFLCCLTAGLTIADTWHWKFTDNVSADKSS